MTLQVMANLEASVETLGGRRRSRCREEYHVVMPRAESEAKGMLDIKVYAIVMNQQLSRKDYYR